MYVMMPCKYNNSANITTYIDKINSNNSIDNADNDNNKYVIYVYIYTNQLLCKTKKHTLITLTMVKFTNV